MSTPLPPPPEPPSAERDRHETLRDAVLHRVRELYAADQTVYVLRDFDDIPQKFGLSAMWLPDQLEVLAAMGFLKRTANREGRRAWAARDEMLASGV